MELQCGDPNRRMSMRSKITLEEYLDFIESRKQLDLAAPYLRQIIRMHGLWKINKLQKKDLIDAVNSIDLMYPSRSTLEDDHVSSCAFITLEEAIKDLVDLNWQECSVTSLQTLNSVNYDLSRHNADTSTSKSKPKSTSRSGEKVLRLGGVRGESTSASAVDGSGIEPSGGTQSACSSAVDDQCGLRKSPRKRKVKNRDE